MSGALAAMSSSRPSPVTITDQTCSKFVADPADATASYTVSNDRTIRKHDGTSLETWLDSSYAVADFEVRATVQSGTTPTGNIGTWNNLATSRAWTQVETSVGTLQCNLLIEIGYAGQNVALDSAVATIRAVVS